jgi:Tfp pilus assembly protein PilN
MRRLELDYVATPRARRWPGWVLLGCSLAFAGVLVERHLALEAELERFEAARPLATERPARPASSQAIAEEAKNTETVVRQLGLPWASLIAGVEAASHPEVALLQLEPQAPQRVLRLAAEARDRDAMLEYLRRLSESGSLREAHLVSHQVQADDPRRPVQFTVQAAFRSAP